MTTHAPAETTSYVNPHHPLSDEAQASLRSLAEVDQAVYEERVAAEQAGRHLKEEPAMKELTVVPDVVERDPMVLDAPEPIDHSFWAATANFSGDGEFHGRFDPDGLRIFGGIFWHSGNLRHAQFKVTCTYGINPPRMPDSPHNRWRSTPHIELFGQVEGHTGDDDVFSGDLWSKCWMHRKQTLVQPTFGGTIAVAQREETQTLIFEENQDRTVRFTAPGFIPMPNLDFGPIRRDLTLLAIIESTFEIQIEGAGSVLQLVPSLLYRGFQWPMQAL